MNFKILTGGHDKSRDEQQKQNEPHDDRFLPH